MNQVKTDAWVRALAERDWRPGWTPRENRVLDACAQGVLAGQFDSVAAAAQVCVERLRPTRPGLPRRSWWAVRSALKRRLRAAGFSNQLARWTLETDRVIKSYARALLRHRFWTVKEASRACDRELDRLRREQPEGNWGKLSRPRTVENRLKQFARDAGWTALATRQSPAALKVYDHYTDRFLAGDFPSIRATARACLEFQRAHPRISPGVKPLALATLTAYMTRRAHASGLPARWWEWTAPEVRVINRHAAAIQRKHTPLIDADAACYRELKRLWRSRSGGGRIAMPRSEKAVGQYLRRRLLALHVVQLGSSWTRAEQGLLQRYARALAQGHYCNLARAATACHAEFIARFQAQGRHYAPRTLLSVRSRLAPIAREFGWSGPGGRLLPEEVRLLRLYARKLARGEYTGCYQAAMACRAALDRLCECRPELRPRAVTTVYRYLRRRPAQMRSHPGPAKAPSIQPGK